MSDKQSPLNCPACGARMNHHADKVDYNVEDPAGDSVFGGTLQEVHTCPACGHVELRNVDERLCPR